MAESTSISFEKNIWRKQFDFPKLYFSKIFGAIVGSPLPGGQENVL